MIPKTLHQLGTTGIIGAMLFIAFLIWLILGLLITPDDYGFLHQIHYWISRVGLAVAIIMLVIAIYIGLIRHGDVTPWFRRVTYTIMAFMVMQGMIGGAMWLAGGRPGEEVHIIYGYGVVLSLPFFVFVEVTAKKRPAMGSYIWGFTMLAAIIVRTITTGPG
ncbi:MAG: hypothetical protein D6711_17290 [Chloroflexi bacterium]|nr:MAG: hypothetical protein D6711_17290 [Chloroflexota bacterium]